MSTSTRETFAQQIASSIERKIRNGRYRIGDKLPTEPQLSEFFGVSRGTVREALKILLSAGILETVQGSGTYVKAVERLGVEMHRTLENTEDSDILDMRKMLERHIASEAARNRKADNLKSIRKSLDRRNSAPDYRSRMEADHGFHMELADATGNRLLSSLYRYISDYQYENEPEMNEGPLSDDEMKTLHENLYRAIQDQDGENAERSMERILEAL